MKALNIINYLCEHHVPGELRGTIKIDKPTPCIKIFNDIVDDIEIPPGTYFYVHSDLAFFGRCDLAKYGEIDYELPAPMFCSYFLIRIEK